MKATTTQPGDHHHSLSRLGGDAATVALGQISSVAYPLVSIPIFSRIFGTDGFGQLLLAMAIVNVLVLFVDFGFAMSALRRVALARTAGERASIVAATVAAKALLSVGGGVVLGLIVLLVPGLRDHWQLYLIGILLTAGDVAYPTWLLQGLGRIKTFALLNATSRLLALVGLLLTVTSASDVNWAIFWQFAPATIAAVGSWFFLAKIGCNQMDRLTLTAAVSALKESFPLFIGSVATIMISAMNTVFLGAFSAIQQVAFYGSAERFSNALRGILGGVQQSMLPRMSASIGAPEGKTLRRWILTSLIIAYGLAGVGLILTASIVVPWYLGDGYKAAIPVAELLGVALCVTGVSTALTLALIAHGQARISSRVLIAAALFHLILLPIACANFGALGAAGAVCATEVLIACLLGWSYRQFLERNSLARTQLPSRSTQGGLVNPTVTIVMPVYNTEDLVERAIHSVLRQSYRNFELIIIDDASTDNSLSAVHSALQDAAPETRSKVRVIARDKNEGYASATNTGVSMSRGEWVWFVDGDDWAEPEMLQRILDAALEHSAEIVVTRMRRVRLATGSGKVLSEWAPRNSVSTGREALKRLARGELLAFQTNKLIARGLWEGIVSPCNTYSDAAIMPELLRRARRVAFVKEPLYNYCRRAESVTGSLRPSAWDLTALPDFISPVLNEVFASRTAQALQKHFIYSVVYWSLINGSASDDSQGGLAKEVHSWARDRIRWNDLLWFATRGRFTLAASLGLAKAAPQLHRQVLGYYKRVSS